MNTNESHKSNEVNEKEIDEVILKVERVPYLEKGIKDLELKQKKLTITIESLIAALDSEAKKNKILKEKIEAMNNSSQQNCKDDTSRLAVHQQIKGTMNNK